MSIFYGLLLFITYLKKAPKGQNNSKFIKEQEVMTNWTIDGTQHQKNKKLWTRHKCA